MIDECTSESPHPLVLSMSINHPGWKNLHDSAELIKKSGIEISIALAPAVKKASEAMMRFGNAWHSIAEREYLKYHDRLPGGTSNARLIKKRKTKVMAWFWKKSVVIK